MIAIATAWGVFWLLIWFALLMAALLPPMSESDKKVAAAAMIGFVVSFAWLVAVGVAAVLS